MIPPERRLCPELPVVFRFSGTRTPLRWDRRVLASRTGPASGRLREYSFHATPRTRGAHTCAGWSLVERAEAHILVCFLAFVLWKTPGPFCRAAGLGDCPRKVLDKLAQIRMVDVVRPAQHGPEIRLRRLIRPERRATIMIERLRTRLPNRIRITEMSCRHRGQKPANSTLSSPFFNPTAELGPGTSGKPEGLGALAGTTMSDMSDAVAMPLST